MTYKLKVTWNPKLDQDLDAMITKGSPFFDQATYDLVSSYPSLEDFKKSDIYKTLKKQLECV